MSWEWGIHNLLHKHFFLFPFIIRPVRSDRVVWISEQCWELGRLNLLLMPNYAQTHTPSPSSRKRAWGRDFPGYYHTLPAQLHGHFHRIGQNLHNAGIGSHYLYKNNMRIVVLSTLQPCQLSRVYWHRRMLQPGRNINFRVIAIEGIGCLNSAQHNNSTQLQTITEKSFPK